MVFNFTPVPREAWRIGVPEPAATSSSSTATARCTAASNVGNLGGVSSEPVPANGFDHSVQLSVPPLGALYLKRRS